MKYRIEYESSFCKFAENRADLLTIISSVTANKITDIRKLYKNGVSDSVMDKYEKFIRKGCCK